ncbi:MAG: replication endonuclease, partial [Gallionellaceae bacterium]|nr:replication endonuclease [Gallionellaceae bacterium]
MSIAELLRQEEIPNALLARIYNRSTTGINNRGEAVQAHINFSKLLIKLAKFTSLIIDPAASAVMDKKFEWAFDKWERHNDETAFYEFIDLAFEVESVVEIQKELTNDNIIKLAKSGFSNFLRFQKFKIIKEDDGRGSLACKLLGLDEHPMFDTELKGRRKLRKAAKQAVAKLNIKLGLIGSIKDGVGKYERCTPYQVGMRNEQKVGWRNFAQNKVMVKNGVAISMLNIMDGAQKKLFDEKYVMVKGLEEFSKKSGMDWVFITLTPPPSFHPNPANGNSSWDGISFANDAMTWLHKNYRSVLLSLRKMEILPAGLWVTEPQKDSTTHIHLLMFANPSDMQTIEDEFRKVDGWNCDAGCKWERNNRLASAASYVFKYIAKSLACYSELSGEQAEVDAWRSTWAIRG